MISLERCAQVLLRSVVILAMVVCLDGCSDSRPLKWTEDVLLFDGRVVTLTRYQEFKGPHEIGQPPTESDYWFEFKHPDTGSVVRWASHRDLATMALMIDNKVPRLLVVPEFDGRFKRKCPDPPYLLFRFDSGEWREESIEALRGRRITPNMTYLGSGSRDEIYSNDHHLSKEQVLKNAPAFLKRRDIDFQSLGTQTFGIRCDPPFDWMISTSGDK